MTDSTLSAQQVPAAGPPDAPLTMIVHRLTNNSDRELVEKASGDIDRAAASFLPTLAPGEAILIGTDFAFPVSVKIMAPAYEPDSKGPNYQKLWK